MNHVAPTTSTTMMLALGDAIALSLSECKKFSKEMFGVFHPGGNIGAKFIKLKDIMHGKSNIPLTSENTNMKDVIVKITNKNFGCIGVLDLSNSLVGIITDGDLRRMINKDINLVSTPIKKVMTKRFKSVDENDLVLDVSRVMEEKKIYSLI